MSCVCMGVYLWVCLCLSVQWFKVKKQVTHIKYFKYKIFSQYFVPFSQFSFKEILFVFIFICCFLLIVLPLCFPQFSIFLTIIFSQCSFCCILFYYYYFFLTIQILHSFFTHEKVGRGRCNWDMNDSMRWNNIWTIKQKERKKYCKYTDHFRFGKGKTRKG